MKVKLIEPSLNDEQKIPLKLSHFSTADKYLIVGKNQLPIRTRRHALSILRVET